MQGIRPKRPKFGIGEKKEKTVVSSKKLSESGFVKSKKRLSDNPEDEDY